MFVLDNIIGFLIRALIRLIRARGSERWPIETAIITSSGCTSALGGSVAHAGYTYRYQGKLFTGGYEKPFVLHDSAKRYAAGLPTGTRIILRVKPGQPNISIVRDKDQELPPVSAGTGSYEGTRS